MQDLIPTNDGQKPAPAPSDLVAATLASVAATNSHRLCKHADYQRVYKAGRKQFAKQIAYFFAERPAELRSETPGPRIGLTVPKALGKAVDRNRIKRRLREAIRHSLTDLTAPVDVVLHPKRSTLTLEFSVIEREVSLIFRSIQSRFRKPSGEARPEQAGQARP